MFRRDVPFACTDTVRRHPLNKWKWINIIKGVETMLEKEIEVKIRELPKDLRREVLDYMEFLLRKYKRKETVAKKFKFDWEGGLSEIREKFTSVELQHKALEWR
jgi:hypothetical protein